MKKLTATVFVSVIALSSFASDEDSARANVPTYQIGVNATFFLKQFLSFSDNTIEPISPYIITCSLHPGRNGLRLGIGGDFSDSKEEEVDSDDIRTTTLALFDMRAGWEQRRRLSKSWWLFFGMDGTYNYQVQKVTSDTQFDRVTTESVTNGFGFGPVFGIQFNFSKRVGLFTETALYYNHAKTVDKTKSQDNPNFDSEDTLTTQTIKFLLPTSLFFVVRLGKMGKNI